MSNIEISTKILGERIMQLRKSKGYSQEELARLVGISRPSLAQIELGNRSIDAIELNTFSLVLGFSSDEFLSRNFQVVADLPSNKIKKASKDSIRVSVPKLQVEKFKTVLLYILESCAGKPNIGETVLNKILYFCDFNYYEIYEEHLTGAKYRRLPYGPVPAKMDGILKQMTENKQIKRVKTDFHGFPQTRFLPLVKPDLTKFSAAEKTVIDDVIQQMGDWNANKISDYSHADKPWKATPEGDFINYNLVFYRRPPFSVRNYEEDEQD
ncbi:MAG: DUF4065 domain-containing protein [Bacteroidetes bacterium]|nr:DUF4065 domain-containing protein [Bacteroidota bacterium]MBU1720064.1 DUF4065 domain-containing protein [Bacteroidota bacterium]